MKEIVDFVQDDDKVREERKKAKKNRNKYVGMSGLQASMHMGQLTSRFATITLFLFCLG